MLHRTEEYRFVETADGFCIEHPERLAVHVALRDGAYQLTTRELGCMLALSTSVRDLSHRLGALMFGTIDEPGAATTLPDWMPDAWAIAPVVARERERLLQRISPLLVEAQAAVEAVCRRVLPLEHWLELAQAPYVLPDVIRYRAAACALATLENGFTEPNTAAISGGEVVAAMRSWRGVFSPDGQPYRSLNRTLMNLSEEVPADLLPHLGSIRLERAITDPLELTTLLLYLAADRRQISPQVFHARARILHHASAEEIRLSVARIGQIMRRRLRAGDRSDMTVVFDFLNDCPDRFHGRLPGLVEHVIRWHRNVHRRVRRQAQRREGQRGAMAAPFDLDQPTAVPSLPLPADHRIRFLATVREVFAEGERMQHCIATYADSAVAGQCYLFHVDYLGEMASFEVDPAGSVRQAHGPRNQHNAAVEWGHEQLYRWAAPLRPRLMDLPVARRPPRPRRPRRPPVDPRQPYLPFSE